MIKSAFFSRLSLILSYLLSFALISIFWAQEAQSKLLPVMSAISFLLFYFTASRFAKYARLSQSNYWSNWFFALLGGFYMTAIFGFLALSISLVGTSVVSYYFVSLSVILIGIFRIKFGIIKNGSKDDEKT